MLTLIFSNFKMKNIFLLCFISLAFSCSQRDEYPENNLSRQVENFNREMTEWAREREKTLLILDNPTNRPIVYQVDDLRDTLPPLVYREIGSDTHKSRILIYDSLGHVRIDTNIQPAPEEEIFVNLSFNKYAVLMKEYKEIDLNFKSRSEMALEELKRMEDAKKPHVYGEISAAADQNRQHEKIKYTRPSATSDYYEIITYFQMVNINADELFVKKFWTLNPEESFGHLQNIKFNAADKYVRQLVRINELEIKKYFASINSSDFVSAVINEKYLKHMSAIVKIVNTYPANVLKEIESENHSSEKFILACRKLIPYCKSGKSLNLLSKDGSGLMKKYDLRSLWPNCRDSSLLVKKIFWHDHIKIFNRVTEDHLY